MTRRRTLLERLWPRRRRGLQHGAHPADHGGPLPPTRPTRMVVSDGVIFGERIRSFDQAHPMTGLDPRLRLWRDTAAVLVVIAVVIALSDWLPRPEQAVLSETLAPTQLLGEPQTSGPGTSEPAIDASSTPDSSETPAASPSPASTPGATPRPTPRPTPRSTPVATPQPSPSASATPAPPTPTPEPPTPTPMPPPPVAVIADPPTCASGSFSISFDGSGSTGVIDTFAWDFGDQSASAEVSPTHDYVSPGPYTVTLTVTGPGGSDIASVEVTAPCP